MILLSTMPSERQTKGRMTIALQH